MASDSRRRIEWQIPKRFGRGSSTDFEGINGLKKVRARVCHFVGVGYADHALAVFI